MWRKRKVLESDPLAGMDLPSQDIVIPRRAFTAEELARLLDATATNAKRVCKMPPAERLVLYSLAVTTGFRVTELARLTPLDFALDAEPPTVSLAGAHTKNGKDACLPLAPSVVARLRPILATRTGGGPVWPGKWQDRAARMIRADMAAAGIPERTPAGVANFHSLRHTFITIVGKSSPLKVVQELARHSTPILTAGRYSHAELSEKASAVSGVLPTGGAESALTRPQLEALAAAALSVLAAVLFTPPLTPEVETAGNGKERVGTNPTPAPTRRAKRKA